MITKSITRDALILYSFISGYGFLKPCVPNFIELIITVQTASKNKLSHHRVCYIKQLPYRASFSIFFLKE